MTFKIGNTSIHKEYYKPGPNKNADDIIWPVVPYKC